MMYKQKRVRDKKGKLIKQDLQSKELPSTRIVPDRRWFGNTRVIGQKQLEEFREDMATKSKDGYTVIIKQKKLPLSLLADPEKGRARRVNLLGTSLLRDLQCRSPTEETQARDGRSRLPRRARIRQWRRVRGGRRRWRRQRPRPRPRRRRRPRRRQGLSLREGTV